VPGTNAIVPFSVGAAFEGAATEKRIAASVAIATGTTNLRLFFRDVRKACSLKNRIDKTPGGGLVS
jgi:hypothetical protein